MTLDLRRERVELLALSSTAQHAEGLWRFQEALAEAIARVEPAAFAYPGGPEKHHLRRLRLLGDALAWAWLHPHAIRQLAKNQGPPPALHDQLGFPATMQTAREACERGVPALVCDLTNCLRVGDVVLCIDRERPEVLESGGHPAFASRGRKGRQKRRREAVGELLRTGTARLPGEVFTTTTIHVDVPPEYTFSALHAAADAARAGGIGWAPAGPGDLVVVVPADHPFDLPAEAAAAIGAMGRPASGVHLRLLERPSPWHPPPHTWPLPAKSLVALSEGELVAVHFVDLDAFERPFSEDAAGVTVRCRGDEVEGLVLRVPNGELEVSTRFLDDVLYGFQTIDSAVAALRALATSAVRTLPDARTPAMRAGSVADLASLAAQETAREALVSVPGHLAADLMQALGPRSAAEGRSPGGQQRVEPGDVVPDRLLADARGDADEGRPDPA